MVSDENDNDQVRQGPQIQQVSTEPLEVSIVMISWIIKNRNKCEPPD